MSNEPQPSLEKVHRFLDEAGDTTFFGKGRVPILGQEGVSLSFGLGMVKFAGSIVAIRQQVQELCREVEADDYVNRIPSVAKRVQSGGFFFHAKDDAPEVRERLFKWIRQTDCSMEMVVGRKIPGLFAKKPHGRDFEFYADLLSHLLKNKLRLGQRLVINVAERGKTTRNHVLELAMSKARERFAKKHDPLVISSEVVFNVQNPRTEPLLCVPDYLAWTVQRVFERGEMRYYNYVREHISLVVDLYDSGKYEHSLNYYTPKRPLTPENKLGPPMS
ncbi:MAG TPA: hypothetical protein PKX23_00285 [Verrucomicrobiota bacterium]|nr:hypothetical protein [Verrucomicrobiota bacterium]